MHTFLEAAIRLEVTIALRGTSHARELDEYTGPDKPVRQHYYPRLQEILRRFSEVCGYAIVRDVSGPYTLRVKINGIEFFHQICMELGIEGAVKYFKDANIATAVLRGFFFYFYFDFSRPFLCNSEWIRTITGCIEHLEQNRQFVVKDGYSKTTYNANFFLSVLLSHSLPIKIPDSIQGKSMHNQTMLDIRNSREFTIDANTEYQFTWVKDREEFVKPFGKRVHCSYDQAFSILSNQSIYIPDLHEIRDKMVSAKIKVLQLMMQFITGEKSLRKGGHFYKEAFSRLFSTFSKHDLEVLMMLDRCYTDFFIQKNKIEYSGVVIEPTQAFRFSSGVEGGLAEVIYLISYLDKELRHYHLYSHKEKVTDAIMHHVGQFCADNAIPISRDVEALALLDGHAYRALGDPRIQQVADQFLRIIKPTEKEDDITSQHRKELLSVLCEKGISGAENAIFEGIHAEFFTWGYLQFGIDTYTLLQKMHFKGTGHWNNLDEKIADWDHISITFLDDHTVRVSEQLSSTKRVTKLTYDQMGFSDKRINRPDKCWEWLYYLARHNGSISIDHEFFDRFRSKGKKVLCLRSSFPKETRYKISERMRNFFGIKGNKRLFISDSDESIAAGRPAATKWMIRIKLHIK